MVVWLSPKGFISESFGTDAVAQETTAERMAQRKAERPPGCSCVSGRGGTWCMGDAGQREVGAGRGCLASPLL